MKLLSTHRLVITALISAVCALAQTPEAATATETDQAPAQEAESKNAATNGVTDKRAYGVLPNYRTADANVPFSPLTTHQKMMIGVKDSFDGAAYPLAAFFTGISQFTNTNPSFGQGVKGFAHRYGTAFSDQVVGNMLTESILPVLFKEDPRFFRKGSGSKMSRIGYAATRVLVCKTDTGKNTFNAPEVLGNGIVGAVGNLYYPDARGGKDTAIRMFTQIGTDTISNVLKEFWPDVKSYYVRKHQEKLARQQKTPPAPGF